MVKASELMTPNPACVTPEASAQEAARLMAQHDCGALPVVEDRGGRLIGMVTDRDLAVRGLANGKGGDTRIRELMTADVATCGARDSVKDVARVMKDQQVRRVPIVDENGRPIGMIAQADLARADHALSDSKVGEVVEEISEPSRRTH
jgi:CBS domain-containing protein